MDSTAFLSRYPGFDHSNRYFAVLDSKHIDSKTFLAAVHAHHFPDKEKLTGDDFHGGDETTRALAHFGISWVDLSQGDGLTEKWTTRSAA